MDTIDIAKYVSARAQLGQANKDNSDKTLAYCRGRVLCALKACGVEEV